MSDADNYEASTRGGKSDSQAEFEYEEKGLLGRIHSILHHSPALVPLIVLVLAVIVFGLLNANFWRVSTLSLIFQQIGIVGILGIAQSLVILTAGIDLSVGAMAVLSSVIMGQFTFRYGIPPSAAIVIGLAAGTAMGALNGVLVAKLRIPPFITTLGTWQIFLAANYIYSANETIRSQELDAEAPVLKFWGSTFEVFDARVTYGVVLLLVLVAIMAYVLRHTAWGRHVYAVGDDEEAAQLSGVNRSRQLIQVYALAGFFCAIAGWVMIGRFGSVSPSASTGQLGNIQAITAVVIGGISLFGGRGTIVGMFLGALIVGAFEMGLRLAGADAQWTYLLIGVLIIAAVAVDQWIRKASA
ncbi:ABC transporter permease [Palleronia pelagia]|uniref:Mannose ABC transporter membrane protein /fructose ABC transporter membrane protein /ribose ABC transporter membrane protein n=1 Tax=Palleronia pelagia TaxID=387096 RepID=A0A1H8L1I7_9RHOB|nr:ABC transporter permease [Palleronia pelagia]SEN98995.1 mannose ABC transporter membrane protein /fructose ABC transporter membrane protein /ribose ABC transporter membrane protein [Palleronia pelagia]